MMGPIIEPFVWSKKCQVTREEIKCQYIEALILISPNRELNFHGHTDAFHLIVGIVLAQNQIGKFDQPILYAFQLLNHVERNYMTRENEALTVVYALHKF